ncbi:MAG: type II secretion system protein [Planctomycetes bacterium]|nr:type II secretion system protein [Planctomycetota bacterium]
MWFLSKKRSFTLVELLVVIAIIALLMGLLMPSLSRAKKQAQAVICQSNLHQWAICFAMYTEDNDNKFHEGYSRSTYSGVPRTRTSHQWMDALLAYYGGVDPIRCCPSAPRKYDSQGDTIRGKTFEPWSWKDSYGSYGINGFVCNPEEAVYGEDEDYWRTIFVRKGANIPIVADALWVDNWPKDSDTPPPTEGEYIYVDTSSFCINRHNDYVNSLFLDSSVRKVGLKELWTLKWHRNFDTTGQWTKAGGVQTDDWPQWMRRLSDY